MATNGRTANKGTESTQKYVDIAEIKEDVVVMKDGTLRAVILVSSINFALKGEDEQQALVSAYMDFINGFEFPFQIVIQSRKLNMERYLTNLALLEKDQKNELLKTQMGAYREYVKELIDIGDIMTKRFYIVLMFTPYSKGKKKSYFRKVRDVFTPGAVIKISKKSFEEYKTDLNIRTNQVAGSLKSMGLQAVALDTQSLIELYYNIYNPSEASTQPLEDINKLQVETSF